MAANATPPTPTELDPAFAHAVRTGRLTEDQDHAFAEQDSLTIKFPFPSGEDLPANDVT